MNRLVKVLNESDASEIARLEKALERWKQEAADLEQTILDDDSEDPANQWDMESELLEIRERIKRITDKLRIARETAE